MHRTACLSAIGASAALGLAFVAFGDPDWLGHNFWLWPVMAILGTQLGQTSLAALWCAVGPGSLALRLPLSAVWLSVIVLASGYNRSHIVGLAASSDLDPVSSAGLMLFTQWLFIAAPLWAFAESCGLRICHKDGQQSSRLPNNRQIGILGTMVITTAVAVVLAGCTIRQSGERSINWGAVRELGLISVTGVVVGLPSGAQLLLVRKTRHWVVAMLLIIAIASVLDLVIVNAIHRTGINARLCWVILLHNLFQSAWIIGTFFVLKLGGYEVIFRPAAQEVCDPTLHRP